MNKKTKKAIALMGLITAVILCSKSPFIFSETNLKTDIQIEGEWQGYYCGYTQPSKMTIYTEEDWKEIWQKLNVLRLPKPELPMIDFEKNMVIAVFMGERRSGGYEIKISKITKTEEKILVEVVEKKPSPESFRTMALTSPYHIVVIKKYPLAVNFQGPQNSQEE